MRFICLKCCLHNPQKGLRKYTFIYLTTKNLCTNSIHIALIILFKLLNCFESPKLHSMRKYISLSLLTAFTLLSISSFGQKCGHDLLEQEVKRLFPNYESAENEFIESINFDSDIKTEGVVYQIPVVVHIIYDTQGDNISDKQVKDAIKVINEDFRRLNADTSDTRAVFSGVAADTEIEFQLAKLDPQGNCTTGITRAQSALSTNANNNVKGIVSWPNSKYLNIWVVNSIDLGSSGSGTVLGYAYKPNPGQSTTYDGIVIRHDRMGRIGTGNSRGRTLTHEAGHYLGLDHPFKGGCFSGDNCADTPPVLEASFGCPLTANTCSNDFPNLVDQIENYMDYADDNCVNMYTDDQKSIMRNSLITSSRRGYLVTSTNQSVTGIGAGAVLPCAPEANFNAEQSVFCAGTTVQFFDKSTAGNPTSWSWEFPGGSPSVSTMENPVVSYSNPGNFNVKLEVTNGIGTSTLLQDGYVSVRSNNNGMWMNGFNSGFEFNTVPNGTWHVENPDGDAIRWERNSFNFYEGSYCVKLDNYNNDADNSDALITDKIVVDRAQSMNFSFKYAVASKPGFASDGIVVSVSQDCGNSWQSVRTLIGPLLYATTNKANPWNPTSVNNWRSSSVSLNDFIGNDPIMIKVDFISGGGNNAFLDDFELSVTLDNEELSAQDISIFPNPSQGTFQVQGLPTGTHFNITSMDGRSVKTGTLNTSGNIELHASAGYYLFHAGNVRKSIVIQ